MIRCKKRCLLAIIISFFLLCSCERSDKSTIVKGVVTDFYSNKPINDYRLKIVRNRLFALDGMDMIVDSSKTGTYGFFQVLLVCDHDFSYKLESDPHNLYSPAEDKIIEPGKTNDYSLTVKRFSILKLNIKNTTHKFDQILILSGFDTRWNLHDTIVYVTNAIPEENYNIKAYLYKTRNSGQEDSVINSNIWIEHNDTSFYTLRL
jgi:hypothetical protein